MTETVVPLLERRFNASKGKDWFRDRRSTTWPFIDAIFNLSFHERCPSAKILYNKRNGENSTEIWLELQNCEIKIKFS